MSDTDTSLRFFFCGRCALAVAAVSAVLPCGCLAAPAQYGHTCKTQPLLLATYAGDEHLRRRKTMLSHTFWFMLPLDPMLVLRRRNAVCGRHCARRRSRCLGSLPRSLRGELRLLAAFPGGLVAEATRLAGVTDSEAAHAGRLCGCLQARCERPPGCCLGCLQRTVWQCCAVILLLLIVERRRLVAAEKMCTGRRHSRRRQDPLGLVWARAAGRCLTIGSELGLCRSVEVEAPQRLRDVQLGRGARQGT